jgi:hypothetical protein
MLPDLNAPAAATGNSRLFRILLIRPHLCAIVHRDAVLKQAGFIVEIAIPTDIPSVVNHCVAAYAVIVISDGISTEETQRMASN